MSAPSDNPQTTKDWTIHAVEVVRLIGPSAAGEALCQKNKIEASGRRARIVFDWRSGGWRAEEIANA